MKRLFVLCTLIMAFISGYAQIMKDSTIQVVAYWNLGDKYKYKYHSQAYTVEGNDTIWGDKTDELFTIEVVDSTANGYILEYRCLEDVHDMVDKTTQAILQPIMDKYKGLPYRFSTNQHGAFQDLANWEEIQQAMDSIMVDIKAGLHNYYLEGAKKEGLDSIPAEAKQQIEAFIDHIFGQMKSKEWTLVGMDYIISPLFYHGARLDLNREYSYKQKYVSPWIPTDMVEADESFYIDKVDYETSWTTFHRIQKYDAGELLATFMKFLMQSYPEEQVKQLTPEQIPFLMVETFFDLDVHVDTGWPGATYYQKVVQVGEKQRVNTWYLDMVFDEAE